MSTKSTPEFEDLIKDNQVNVSELPKKTQDLIAKFNTITDKEASDAMDQKIYLHVKDFLAEKVAAAKKNEEETKKKVKKDGIDVSGADTAAKKESPEEKAAREAAAAAPKKRSLFDAIYGRK